ncbi:MAG: hypothetical protein LUE89_01155 [Clostridiales bacterium]|nr:hypothetical protein [Clostridiales bacterium]
MGSEKNMPPENPPSDTVSEDSVVILDDQPRMVRLLVRLPQAAVAGILAVAMLVVFGLGYGAANYNVQNRLVAAQSAGYDTGYAEGQTAGYDTGYSEGNASGYDSGYDDGTSDGYSSGYEEGAVAGYDSGYDAGVAVSYDTGYEEGYSAGTTDGYDSGYSEGQTAGHDAGYEEGYSAGKAAVTSSSSSSTSSSDSGNSYTYSNSVADSTTVYVSKSGHKIHLRSNCSGMKYYTEMTYATAKSKGYEECKNCF